MTPNSNKKNGRSHRRSKPAETESAQNRQSADSGDDNVLDDELLDDESIDDELLAAAIFAEDALSPEMLIGSKQELEDFEDETFLDPVAEARMRISVDELLGRLVNQADDVALGDLYVLSDLSSAEVDAVEAHWPAIPLERRQRLIRELVNNAEELVELFLGRLLRIALHDSDALVRRLAIDGLWEETDPALIGPYVQLLANDPDSGVRAAAAGALGPYVLAGELDELDAAMAMRAEEALLAAVHGKDESLVVQARALESLAYSSEVGLRQLIEDAYYAPEEIMRLSALRAMGRSADSRWRSMVRAELTSPDAPMRAEAARASGELEIKAATPQIIALLEDDNLEVRLAAIDALGHLGGKAARDVLRRIAAEDEGEEADAAEIALDELLFYDEVGAVPLIEGDEEEDPDDPDFHGYGASTSDDDDADDDDTDDDDTDDDAADDDDVDFGDDDDLEL